MTSQNLLFDIFFQNNHIVSKNLASYLNKPTEKNIHNLRISIRRLESTYFIIPKSSKTKSSERYLKQFKKLFSMNSKIRDYDIIIEKFLEYKFESDSEIIVLLLNKRDKKLSQIQKLAKKLSKLKTPQFRLTDSIHSKFEKQVLTLINRIEQYAPIVVEDESKVDELHYLRKTIKKLRYILEIEKKDSYQNLISNLKHLQKTLGKIHDCDIFIWYLEKISDKDQNISSLVNRERYKRSNLYSSLIQEMSEFSLPERSPDT